jgi:hypothetical protein
LTAVYWCRNSYRRVGLHRSAAWKSAFAEPAHSVCAGIKSEPGPPMTLGNAAKAELRLIVGVVAAGI